MRQFFDRGASASAVRGQLVDVVPGASSSRWFWNQLHERERVVAGGSGTSCTNARVLSKVVLEPVARTRARACCRRWFWNQLHERAPERVVAGGSGTSWTNPRRSVLRSRWPRGQLVERSVPDGPCVFPQEGPRPEPRRPTRHPRRSRWANTRRRAGGSSAGATWAGHDITNSALNHLTPVSTVRPSW